MTSLEDQSNDCDTHVELTEAASRLLSNHSHLDLTERVQLVNESIRGHGGFSDVYCGRFVDSGKYVAIKRLRVHFQKERQLSKNISRELRIWSLLHHPNVLPFLGYTLHRGSMFAFISEWMEHGTAREYLKKHPEADTFQMVAGIAAGLHYLHQQQIVHSDVKSDNVLISPLGVPMLSDFGVSRVVVASHVTTDMSSGKGSMRWMALEFFMLPDSGSSGRLVVANEKTDVWAFGMTIYEMLAGKRPFEDITNDAQVMFAIASGSLPSAPDKLQDKPIPDQELWKLCQKYWIKSPILRPVMGDIVAEIDNHLRGNDNSRNSVRNIRGRASDVTMARREDHYPLTPTNAVSDNNAYTFSPQDVRLPLVDALIPHPPNGTSAGSNVFSSDLRGPGLPGGPSATLCHASSPHQDDSLVSDPSPRLNGNNCGPNLTIQELAAYYGIPQVLPSVPYARPHISSQFGSTPGNIDQNFSNFDSLRSNYLSMLSQEPEDHSVSADTSTMAARQLKSSIQAVVDKLQASPDDDILTSPFDDMLTSPFDDTLTSPFDTLTSPFDDTLFDHFVTPP